MLFQNYSVGNVADQMKFDSCSFEQQPLQNYLETKELFIQTAAHIISCICVYHEILWPKCSRKEAVHSNSCYIFAYIFGKV